MKMEEEAVVVGKESWCIDMKQRFVDGLCKMRVNTAKKIVFS